MTSTLKTCFTSTQSSEPPPAGGTSCHGTVVCFYHELVKTPVRNRQVILVTTIVWAVKAPCFLWCLFHQACSQTRNCDKLISHKNKWYSISSKQCDELTTTGYIYVRFHTLLLPISRQPMIHRDLRVLVSVFLNRRYAANFCLSEKLSLTKVVSFFFKLMGKATSRK